MNEGELESTLGTCYYLCRAFSATMGVDLTHIRRGEDLLFSFSSRTDHPYSFTDLTPATMRTMLQAQQCVYN